MTNQPESETIFALASARGMAGVAVIRLSGKKARQTALNMIKNKEIEVRTAKLKTLVCPISEKKLDQVLVLFFAQPNSFTGQDVVEFHCHGSSAVIEAISRSLIRQGLRLADPGEFSRRAFTNGKMDLVQAEGLVDLIDAKTEGQRQQALRQMGGALSHHIGSWRKLLLAAIARVEAEIDFPDEEDVTGALAAQVLPGLKELQEKLASHLKDAKRGQKIRDGYLIALVGPVNAGKSTLLNVLAGGDRAIVSERPGTTRDVIEVELQIGGYVVHLADTAGLRKTVDEIEKEGIRRAVLTAEKADLRLFLTETGKSYAFREDMPSMQAGDLVIKTKKDIHQNESQSSGEIHISAKTGEGIEMLLQQLEKRVIQQLAPAELPALSQIRHIQAVKAAGNSLRLAENELENMPELAAEHLRAASQSLAGLLGEVHTEQILGEIFSGFCIGK